MANLRLIAASALILAIPMSGALAQTPPPANTPKAAQAPETTERDARRAEMRERLIAADTNSDGQWSREEWLAAGRRERGFDMMDADKNNQITREEMRAGMEKMRGSRRRSGNTPE